MCNRQLNALPTAHAYHRKSIYCYILLRPVLRFRPPFIGHTCEKENRYLFSPPLSARSCFNPLNFVNFVNNRKTVYIYIYIYKFLFCFFFVFFIFINIIKKNESQVKVLTNKCCNQYHTLYMLCIFTHYTHWKHKNLQFSNYKG